MKYKLSLKEVIIAIVIGLALSIPMMLSPFQVKTQLLYETIIKDKVKGPI